MRRFNDHGLPMRVLILGAGAVGGYFGGRLLEAGGDATFFVRRARAQLLASRGLRLDSPAGNLVTAVKTISDPEALTPFDLVLLTCKAYDLNASLNDIAGAVGPTTTILPLLNGLVHIEKIAARFPQLGSGGASPASARRSTKRARSVMPTTSPASISARATDAPTHSQTSSPRSMRRRR